MLAQSATYVSLNGVQNHITLELSRKDIKLSKNTSSASKTLEPHHNVTASTSLHRDCTN